MPVLSVGIDLGAEAAKLICLSSLKTGYKLIAHALVRRDHIQDLKELLSHPEFKRADIRIAIQDPKIKIQKLKVPLVPPEELVQVVTWEFREATNITVDDFIIRFLRNQSQREETKQNI